MTNIVALIPARAGSKSVPGKNIRLLHGHPLLAYSIVAAIQTPLIDRVIVSTDSIEYAELSRTYGAETPFIRPPEFSGDLAGDFEVISHMLAWLEQYEGYQPDYIGYLRPTTPIRNPDVLNEAFKIVTDESYITATSLRSAHEMPETAYKCLEIAENGLFITLRGSYDIETANQPRQLYPKTYQANGYIDIFKTKYILEKNKVLGDKVIPFITEYTTEIDTLDEFNHIECQIEKNSELFHTLFNGK